MIRIQDKSWYKDYYKTNKEKYSKKHKEYYNKNKQKFVDYSSRINCKYTKLKAQSKKRNIEMLLSFEEYKQFIENKTCYYCDGPLSKQGYGLDRIDNNQGYKLDNILSCCTECNRIKSNKYTVKETKGMIKWLINYRKDFNDK